MNLPANLFLRGGDSRKYFRTTRLRRAAFTLLELLVVLAIIGVLAALIFPALGTARRAAQVARTRVQFSQWAAAVAAFRSEYGRYPEFDSSGLVNAGASPAPAGEHRFHDILAGRRRDGSALVNSQVWSAAAQNPRGIRFHAFSEAELTGPEAPAPSLVQDGSGNTAIAVLVDRDLDGAIRVGPDGDYPAVPAVAGMVPAAAEIPPTGIRAGVAFYVPLPGASPVDPRFVFSWK